MPSSLQVDRIQSANGVTTYLNNGTLSNLTFPSGHVVKTQVFSSSASNSTESSGSYEDSAITSGSFSHASGSKVLIIAMCQLKTTEEGWFIKVNGTTSGPEFEYYNATDNVQVDQTTYIFLDSPSGTSTTYTVQFKRNSSGTATFYNNKSQLILMEVKG